MFEQKLPVQGAYWCIPVSEKGTEVKIELSSADGGYARSLTVLLGSKEQHDFYASYPADGNRELVVRSSDAAFFDGLVWREEPYPVPDCPEARQEFHYSPRVGWLNDPNGLFCLDGLWHMFHQYNPLFNRWQNMHWLHCVSSDLVHWEEREMTIAPEADAMAYSGGAFVDVGNDSGLQSGAEPPVLLFYTAAEPGNFRQGMYYSTDGGKTFARHRKFPLFEPLDDAGDERDPIIVRDDESGCYLMGLYLGDKYQEFALLRSENLLDWKLLQRFSMPGGGRECPCMAAMRDEVTGERRYLLLEANGRYMTGRFDGSRVHWEGPVRDFLHRQGMYGAYAGQIFNHAPDGKVYFIAWQVDQFRCPVFSQSMTLPVELTLRNGLLCAAPWKGFSGLRRKTHVFEPFDGVNPRQVEGRSLEIEIDSGDRDEICVNLGGVAVVFDPNNRELRLGCCKISYPDGERAFRGTFFVDRNTVEVFDRRGRFYTAQGVNRTSECVIEFCNNLQLPLSMPRVVVHELASIR